MRDEPHKPGMAYAISICQRARLQEDTLMLWFGGRSESLRRARLHGWRLWYTYCVENDITVPTLLSFPNPAVLVANFISAMDAQGVKEYRIKEAKVAILELFEFVFPQFQASLQVSPLIRTMMGIVGARNRRAERYHEI